MKAIDVRFFHKTLLPIYGAMLMTLSSQGVLATDFIEETAYLGNAVAWDLNLPRDATGVHVRVVYTPNKLLEDSYLDQLTFSKGSKVVYPFFSDLEDGTYTWELRVLKEGPVVKGFSPNSKSAEGPIDVNGREIEIVGKPVSIKGRTMLSNRGRDSIQTGSFSVVRGSIPDFEALEEK